MSRVDNPFRSQGRQKMGASLYRMVTSPGCTAGAWTASCPTQPRVAAATTPRHAFDRIGETTCAKPQPAGGRCAVLGRMPWSGRLRLGPANSEMVYRNGKVNRLLERPARSARAEHLWEPGYWVYRYSSGCSTVLGSCPRSKPTEATARPPFRAGVMLTARKPEFSPTALSAALLRSIVAFAIATLCALADVRSSPSVMASVLASLPST